MDHLGERLSALVDGELGQAEHERALIHLAKCESCRFEADMMRRLKRRLTGLGEPEPDHDFLGRLTSLSRDTGGSTDDRGRPGPPPGGAGFGQRPPLGSSRPLGGHPLGGHPLGGPFAAEAGDSGPVAADPGAVATRPSGARTTAAPETGAEARPARRRGAERLAHLFPPIPGGRYAFAGVAVVTALLGSAFVAGGDDDQTPVVEPRLADYAVEHAVTSRNMPVVGPSTTEPQPEGAEALATLDGQSQTIGEPNPTGRTHTTR
ncbi:zf-HC2 domain-containing protein [Nocardiopsis sp. EMB25]|uniref:zf-HC2 domain-containing protein n=1 Tax=Nocardiopsis TaxID=2013 RepID=UPI000A020A58|nr:MULTISPECIES: zf-HC2 domain-containing protein [Nocardiopsis]MCY9785722.1 zf-HC2 domain-containing protein [Nocardiopsis sp. EMB25]